MTVGIIIALSLEGALEWVHHRHLVHEARANIEAELTDNQTKLENALRDVISEKSDMEDALRILGTFTPDKPWRGTLHVSYNDADLNDSSWTTAESTGALGYMSYSEVKRYSELYKLQASFLNTQQKLVDRLLETVIEPNNVKGVADAVAEITADRRSLLAVQQVGHALEDVYKKRARE